ncbi:MAG: asparagine--tRNA ligase [Candidatus Kerfeldbacteria bacterium]|nr:asparagine--tRNA ligase [Candidatus Kerfeldbacteria bacterium]
MSGPTLPFRLRDARAHVGESVTVQGWAYNVRSSGSIAFVQVRDGSGTIQAVISKSDVQAGTWEAAVDLTIESSLTAVGALREDKRSPEGVELVVTELRVIHRAEEYPISKKEHGVDFLMDHRHLWLRAKRQTAILRIRDTVIRAMRDGMRAMDFTLTDSPILTPTAAEGTTTLFKTIYFDEQAYLAQTGQLYIEATAAALGRVFDFGPTFRSEKSKTRRHLTEFWMLDAEAAFVDFEENLKIQEQLLMTVIERVLAERRDDLEILERDSAKLEVIKTPFPRIRYDEAVARVNELGGQMKVGDDFGADEEALLSKSSDQPQFITHYPSDIKAFYMKPDPDRPDRVLNADLLAPEGYGEIIGGSQRIDDAALLEAKIKDFGLKLEDYAWYVDLRRYGSFPHSGFGIGLERTVTWLCKLDHVRESIPFPRLMNRLRP